MICIYDTVIEKGVTTLKRYGVSYKLEKRFKMGTKTFFSFVASDREKILVVNDFAMQYRAAQKKFAAFKPGHDFKFYKSKLGNVFNRTMSIEDYPEEASEDGIMKVVSLQYEDIQLTFSYMNHEMTMGNEFEIVQNNIFGEGIYVTMDIDTT